MTIDNTNHQQIQQLLPLVPSGMLTDAERQQVVQHIAVCEACRATLDQLIQADRELAELFAPVNPPLGFEERVLANWRPARFNISLRPGSRKVIAAAAAAILLGTVGYVGGQLIDSNRLPGAAVMLESGRAENAVRSNLKQVGQGLKLETLAYDFDNGDQSWGESRDGDRKAGNVETERELRRNSTVELGETNGDGLADLYITTPAERQLGEKAGRGEANGKVAALGDIPVLGRVFQPTGGERDSLSAGWGLTENGRSGGNGTLSSATSVNSLNGGTLLLTDGTVAGKPVSGEGVDHAIHGAVRYDNGHSNDFVSLGSTGLAVDSNALGLLTTDKAAEAKGKESGKRNTNKTDSGAAKLSLATTAHFKPSELNAWYFDAAWDKQAGKGEKQAEEVEVVAKGGDVAGKAIVAASDVVALGNNTTVPEAATAATGLKLRVDAHGAKNLTWSSAGTYAYAVADGAAPEAPAGGGTAPPKVEPPAPAPGDGSVLQARKIIRNGDMEFEVESFDTAFATISRIVGEEKGYVSSTSSEKLPNGKVRGVIVVRVVPDRLDTLVLKLRALGDLKSQKISAQDITKVYYDLDSELRAAHTMQDRIISIIQSGKGEVKDLIEAEKQLGTYREKIEKLEGEIRYYNNMVSLSTLNITAAEKAITSPATVQVTENVSTGIETEDVEKARADAIKGIEELKGRVLDSNLKKYDGGQFAANITAEIAPESSGQLIDRLRQIGRVTRLDIDRKQTSPGQALPNAPTPRVEKKDTRFVISIYNLANIAPRQTTTSSLAVTNVEEAYKAILASVKAHGGRVVSSNLNRQKPEQTTAAIAFEVPADQADATLLELRRDREVMTLTVAENPDTQNVTAAKHGFSLSLSSLASVAPRETETVVLVSKTSVTDAFHKLLADLAKADVRILTSQLNEQDASNLSGSIDIEVLRTKETEARAALASAGTIFSRNVARSSDTENTVDTKIRVQIRMVGLNQLAPAQTARLTVETPDVETRAGELKEATVQLGGRVLDSRQMTSATGQVSSRLLLDVPLAKARDLRDRAQNAGKVRTTDSTQNPVMLDSPLARARIEVNLTNAAPLVSDNSGLGEAFRKAVATSVRGLLWSVQAIIIGALIVIPWAAILWGGWKVVRRRKAVVQQSVVSGQ